MADETTQTTQETAEGAGQKTGANTEANAAPEGDKTGEKKAETLTLTQDALDRIIDERLNRQRAQLQKRQDEEKQKAEALRLAEQGEFKALADQRAARILELETELSTREQNAIRATVAARHKLPEHWIPRIQGTTEAEMDADAAKLAQDMAPPRAPATESGAARPLTDAQSREKAAAELRRRYASSF
jgi:hypothetical protein